MPTTLIAAAFFGGDLILMGAALGTVGVAVASFAVSYALSQVIARAFKPNAQTGTNQSVDNGVRLQGPPSNTNSIPVVYGDAYLGGIFTDAVLTTDQKTMYYVMTVSAISPNGQFFFDTTKFYYSDRLITFDTTDLTKVVSLTDGAGNVDTKINGNLYVALYTSTQAGVITSLNGAALPTTYMGGADIALAQRWAASGRQMNGLAFAIVKLNYSREAQTTQMQALTFKAQHYLNGTGVAKPGDVWYDYMTNETYGAAMDTTIVDTTQVTALNAYSDATITYTPSGGGSATQARYRINGVLDTGMDCLQNIDRIMSACDSWTQYNATTGKWAIVINKAEATTFAFNDSNIMSDIRVSSYDLTSSINQIQASFPSKLNRDQTDYVYIETPSGLLYPNEPVNKLSITLDLVNDSVQAQYLANRQLEQAREDLIVTFSTPYPGIQVDAGDVVSVTNADYGWTNKLFRVMKVAEKSQGMGDLSASIDLIEYNAEVYDDAAITAYTPAANSNLANPSYFSVLAAPTVSNQLPTAIVPTFDVTIYIPATGRVTMFTLFYTTVATPTASDWLVYGTQSSTNSNAYTPSTNFTFTNIQMPTGTYYFAYKVQNEISASLLSAQSTGLSWAPNPTTTAVAGTFLATFSPSTTLVPRTGGVSPTPQFTGLITQLYGTAAGGAIDFVTAQTDSAGSFANNTWRIGGSSTTGNADIVTTGGLTLSAPTDGGTYAQWAIPTAMASSPATLTVPVRYKSALGVVSQGANAILQFTFSDQGADGNPGAPGNQTATVYLYQWSTSAPTNPTGTSTYTWSTGANTSYSGLYSWSVTVPANPGTPGLSLWIASKQIVATAGTASTSVDWTTGVAVSAYSTNGVNGSNGTRTAILDVYQLAATAPTSFPVGTSTYTWATGQFTAPGTLNGWSLTPPAPVINQILWVARTVYADSLTTSTTSITWTASTALSISASGQNGTRTAFLEVYIWAASTPTVFPSGTSTYTWATGAFTAPSTANGWSITPGASTPGYILYGCSVSYADTGTSATSSISWTTATAYSVGAAGNNGLQTATPVVYQWAITIPASPTGTSTYTWASGTFTPTPSGWSQTITTAPSAGYTLWAARVTITDSFTVGSTTINWGLSSIVASGYAGTNGTNGIGINGLDGLSSRICYAKATINPLSSTPATFPTDGPNTFPPNNTWGGSETWVATPMALAAGEYMFQSDGIYNPNTVVTSWNAPYLSNLKVGSLSAISANMGTITAGDLSIGSNPQLSGTSMTGVGSHLYSSGAFAFGNSATNMVFNGSSVYLNGFVDTSSTTNSIYNTLTRGIPFEVHTFNVTKTSQIIYGTQFAAVFSSNDTSVISAQWELFIALTAIYPAVEMVPFTFYKIRSVGTTNFMALGAPNNDIGTLFTKNSTPPTGTGTVYANLDVMFYKTAMLATLSYVLGNRTMSFPVAYSGTANVSPLTIGYGITVTAATIFYWDAAGNGKPIVAVPTTQIWNPLTYNYTSKI